MRFLSRVLRASASAGVNSTLRSSTPPFFPLLALPSASAFSVRLAESRAAISPALGLPGAAATPALPGAAATLAGILDRLGRLWHRLGGDPGRNLRGRLARHLATAGLRPVARLR